MTTQKLWISDNGDVTCEEHAGAYLRCAIEAKPKAKQHKTNKKTNKTKRSELGVAFYLGTHHGTHHLP